MKLCLTNGDPSLISVGVFQPVDQITESATMNFYFIHASDFVFVKFPIPFDLSVLIIHYHFFLLKLCQIVVVIIEIIIVVFQTEIIEVVGIGWLATTERFPVFQELYALKTGVDALAVL